MLSDIAEKNIISIKKAAEQIWGTNHKFGKLKEVISSPYSTFDWQMTLYDKIDVLLSHELSMLCISVKVDGSYKYLGKLTDKNLAEDFNSCKSENLQYDFKILDEIAKEILANT